MMECFVLLYAHFTREIFSAIYMHFVLCVFMLAPLLYRAPFFVLFPCAAKANGNVFGYFSLIETINLNYFQKFIFIPSKDLSLLLKTTYECKYNFFLFNLNLWTTSRRLDFTSKNARCLSNGNSKRFLSRKKKDAASRYKVLLSSNTSLPPANEQAFYLILAARQWREPLFSVQPIDRRREKNSKLPPF